MKVKIIRCAQTTLSNLGSTFSPMISRLLIISGPTATGKTGLAVKIARKLGGELVSADSRQIYRGMDIGTGKDHPKTTPVHLIDLVPPSSPFSVAQYRPLAVSKIIDIQNRGLLPIVVGGSGQYIESILSPQPTFSIPPKPLLRRLLNPLPVSYLQYIYRLLDGQSFRLLNNSDRHNPHRLIRKIEIKLSRQPDRPLPLPSNCCLHISLTAPNRFLFDRIDARIKQRLDGGLLSEIDRLLLKYRFSDPGLNCLAYKEFSPYFLKKDPRVFDSCLRQWQKNEHAYARRQKTYHRRFAKAVFFDISQTPCQKIVDYVVRWYNKPC